MPGGTFEGSIDCHIKNFTALSVVGVLQYAFLPLTLFQILKLGNYLTIYMSCGTSISRSHSEAWEPGNKNSSNTESTP